MTHTLNPNQVQEEEDERRAAVVEKQNRTTATSTAASIGTDPPMRRVKILMLGDSGVGKSSLINRWTLDTFSPTLVSTVGVDFKAKKVPLDGETLNVQVWDTAGQEHFHKITQSYYKGCNGIMLIYDVSDKQTLENVEYWVKKIKKHALDSVHVALIGNKTDLRDINAANPALAAQCCDSDAGKNVAQKFGVPFFETSAKEGGVKVDEAFQTVLRCIISGDGFPQASASASTNKPKSKSLAQKLEKTKDQGGIFSSFGKKDKKAQAAGGGNGNGSGDETASNDSTSSASSAGSANSSSKHDGRGGKDDKDCVIS
jgi:small GTP-binding protein